MKVYGFVVALLFFISCSTNNITIKGTFNSVPNEENIYLELVSTGGQQITDTAQIKNGSFKFKVDLTNGEPAIYNIRYKNQIIPLLVSSGDNIKLNALGNISQTYIVEGSEGSKLMREITYIMNSGAATLDSITNIYSKLSGDNDSLRRVLASQYAQNYYKVKREQIRFIVTNPGSLASLYALYQRLPNDQVLFNGENDVVYFRLVADSLSVSQPSSPYLQSLQKEIAASSSNINLSQLIEDAHKNSSTGYPDIEMSDMYGKKIKLSSLSGKVILLDFWSAASPASRMVNAELKEIYERLAPNGFEIYQISLDESKPLWVTTVQDQKLPWVSVSDFRGTASPSARIYNVKSLPCNFLISRDGTIVSKNLTGSTLEAKVKQLL